jgi:hypothetical protein
VPIPTDQQITPVLVYFSLTTIATVGYGDITPLSLQARYASVAEGIAGQFYLSILVARLVGMQAIRSLAGKFMSNAADYRLYDQLGLTCQFDRAALRPLIADRARRKPL